MANGSTAPLNEYGKMQVLGIMILRDYLMAFSEVFWSCHSGTIQSEEVLGQYTTIGADGWPVNANHPVANLLAYNQLSCQLLLP